jgi:hypothetical protein
VIELLAALALVLGVWAWVIGPACVLAHELGHAAAVLLRTDRRATVRCAWGVLSRQLVLGRVTLILHPGRLDRADTRYDRRGLTVAQRRAVVAGGPLVSLALGGAGLALMTLVLTPWSLAFWLVAGVPIVNAGALVKDVLLRTPRPRPSDGDELRALHGRRATDVPVESELPVGVRL